MEQQNKYYTPDAADIYPGYEYEFNGNKVNYESVGEWFKNIAGTEPEECSILDQWGLQDGKPSNWYIQQEWVRTKYLDREDIESLGWKNVEILEEMGYIGCKADRKRGLYPETLTIISWPTYTKIKSNLGGILFNGKIKSKNELRKIMQLVGITQ